MAAGLTLTEHLNKRVKQAAKPTLARWDALTPPQRALATWAAIVVFAAFILTFVVLPAIHSRQALTARLPQLESQLAVMRRQAAEVAALAKVPGEASAPRSAASVANLQSIFGPGAQITVVPDGFRLVIPVIEYAGWWDKTGEAMAANGLVLRETTLVRAGGSMPATVAVDMRLAFEAKPSTPQADVTPTSPGK